MLPKPKKLSNSKNKHIFLSYIFILVFLLSLLLNSFNQISFNNLPDNFYTNMEEIANINKDKSLGKFYSAQFECDKLETGEQSDKTGTVIFKLFGIIPIKKVKVDILPEEDVYIGGVPIGLNISTNGAIVVSNTIIDSQTGKVASNKVLKNGDIILKINDRSVSSASELEEFLNNNLDAKTFTIEILRHNKLKTLTFNCIKNKDNKSLGVWVKDDLSGIGTLTFVKPDQNFVALGHPVTDASGENNIPLKDGSVYGCSLLGIEKGQINNPGQLKCLFTQTQKNGTITKNTKFGIVGKYDDTSQVVDSNLTAKIGGRLSVKPGKASIISSVSGIREEYEIEIIKANYQSTEDDKSMVFRVTDQRLIELTGGIVQGMSGSPILQNGKIIGAVTHVFIKDPTKGYGVYADWMLKEIEEQIWQ